jgi:hypothetical protein
MWEQLDRIMRDATARFTEQVIIFLPGVLAALGLLVAALVVAVLARLALIRLLRTVEFDQRVERLGLSGQVHWPGSSPSMFIARSVHWIILLSGVLVSLTALNAAIPSQFALSVFQYVPHVMAALFIAIAGGVAARLLAQSVLIGAVNMRLQSARLLSLAVKWIVLIITVAMVLDHLGIGSRILPLAFGIVLGGVVFAASLAVGLGSRDAVSRALDHRFKEPDAERDKLDHV